MPRNAARSCSIFSVLESYFKQAYIEFRRFSENEALNPCERGIKSPSPLALARLECQLKWECRGCGWRFQGRLVGKNSKV